MPNKKRTIAVFDFDDTLITIDTLPDFLRHSFSWPILTIYTLRAMPILALYKLHVYNNNKAKERLLAIFLRGIPRARFKHLCETYRIHLEMLTNDVALNRVKWHQRQGDEVIIVSSSIEDWIAPWAQEHHIKKVIATKLDVQANRLSGKLNGPNCYGPEKAHRFLAEYPDRSAYTLYMYGDGKSDKEMFELADLAFKGVFE